VRRDPDIRWRRREEDLAVFAREQLALLSRASEVVRHGGRLIYATCSSEPEENDDVVAMFLRDHGDFSQVPLDASGHPVVQRFADERGFFRTSPAGHGLEAFFAAVLTRA
jgi:16S rRNA (cytosine967-C5)-methyltransferase